VRPAALLGAHLQAKANLSSRIGRWAFAAATSGGRRPSASSIESKDCFIKPQVEVGLGAEAIGLGGVVITTEDCRGSKPFLALEAHSLRGLLAADISRRSS